MYETRSRTYRFIEATIGTTTTMIMPVFNIFPRYCTKPPPFLNLSLFLLLGLPLAFYDGGGPLRSSTINSCNTTTYSIVLTSSPTWSPTGLYDGGSSPSTIVSCYTPSHLRPYRTSISSTWTPMYSYDNVPPIRFLPRPSSPGTQPPTVRGSYYFEGNTRTIVCSV